MPIAAMKCACRDKHKVLIARIKEAAESQVAHPPQPHAEQQADEGEDCQGLADHRS